MAKQRVFKSKRKLSKTRATYRAWGEWDVGDIIVGTFKGEQTDQYDKPNWLLDVEEAFFTNKKEQKRIKGQILGMNSSGKLDAAMKDVEEGDMIQVEYKGMSTIEKGKYKGKDAHDIEVDLVEEEGEESEEDENEEEDEDADEGDEDDL